jgi:hypothetical protein
MSGADKDVAESAILLLAQARDLLIDSRFADEIGEIINEIIESASDCAEDRKPLRALGCDSLSD